MRDVSRRVVSGRIVVVSGRDMDVSTAAGGVVSRDSGRGEHAAIAIVTPVRKIMRAVMTISVIEVKKGAHGIGSHVAPSLPVLPSGRKACSTTSARSELQLTY